MGARGKYPLGLGGFQFGGRKKLRHALVEAAHIAALKHPHWKVVLARVERRLDYKRAIVAVARKLLVAVWHILAKSEADEHAIPVQVACSFFKHAYDVGVKNLPEGQSALQFTRNQLDRLGIGAEVERIPWGTKSYRLPPSRLTPAQSLVN